MLRVLGLCRGYSKCTIGNKSILHEVLVNFRVYFINIYTYTYIIYRG